MTSTFADAPQWLQRGSVRKLDSPKRDAAYAEARRSLQGCIENLPHAREQGIAHDGLCQE